ncbi:MAG TPA: hypothetical protein VKV95_09705 [Terriglobia bacterium]|nr:hypothetical protein [Terriglobia bacterium]
MDPEVSLDTSPGYAAHAEVSLLRGRTEAFDQPPYTQPAPTTLVLRMFHDDYIGFEIGDEPKNFLPTTRVFVMAEFFHSPIDQPIWAFEDCKAEPVTRRVDRENSLRCFVSRGHARSEFNNFSLREADRSGCAVPSFLASSRALSRVLFSTLW